jgi:hypothetical protein
MASIARNRYVPHHRPIDRHVFKLASDNVTHLGQSSSFGDW